MNVRVPEPQLPSPGLNLPTRLGRYEIVGRIASGGMAEVYLAVHGELAGLRTPVAVKRVLPQLARDPALVQMFLEEARIVALLDHPNLVRIIEIGCDGNEYFQAMELVQGVPLWMLVNRSREPAAPLDGVALDERLAAFIVAQAAAGLHHAHNLSDRSGSPLKLVHRDVSPQNILISFEGAVKVIDFGIARSLGRISWTQTGMVRGKCAYMSPEQARGQGADVRSDIFALGVVLWEAVTGRRLFERDNPVATMHALIYEPVVAPSTLAPVSPRLDAIIMRALARDKADRQPSALELGRELDNFLAESGAVGSRELSVLMKSLFAKEHASWRETVRAVQDTPWRDEPRVLRLRARLLTIAAYLRDQWRRHWYLALAGAALVVVLLASLVVLQHAGPRPSLPAPPGPEPAARVPVLPGAPEPRTIEVEPLPLAAPELVATRPDPAPPPVATRRQAERGPDARQPTRGRSPVRSASPARRVTPSNLPPLRVDRRPNPFRL
jgi:eukaryotic-like serine/threonine-protein kinase